MFHWLKRKISEPEPSEMPLVSEAAIQIQIQPENPPSADAERRILQFGAQEWVTALCARIDERCDDGQLNDDPSLVIGLYGEWGSGKSTLLHAIQDHYLTRLEGLADEQAPTLCIWFNAWRYEREEHLIIPLLKTAEQSLLAYQAKPGLWQKIQTNAQLLGHSIIAVASGMSGKLTIPLLGELSFSVEKMLAAEKKRWDKIAAQSRTAIDQLQSNHFNFIEHMQGLTGRRDIKVNGKQTARINLVFLIDDLDRCLPDKSVEMLEAIKLFLEVPGCAFVLALDDQVVHRGIDYRYRHYHTADRSGFEAIAHSIDTEHFSAWQAEQRLHKKSNLISGNEYLEKIIHLPVAVPKPDKTECADYLVQRFPQLTTLAWHPPQETPSDIAKQVIELLANIVPPVPRKLNRVAEMLLLQVDIAQQRSWSDIDLLFLTRLICLQLFTPELYRFGWRERGMFITLWTWAEQVENWDADLNRVRQYLDDDLAKLREDGTSNERYLAREKSINRLDMPLLQLLRDARAQRSGFDPCALVDINRRPPTGIHRYYQLQPEQERLQSKKASFTDFVAPSSPIRPATPVVEENEAVYRKTLDSVAQARKAEELTMEDFPEGHFGKVPVPEVHFPAEPEVLPEAQLEDLEAFFNGLISTSESDVAVVLEQERENLAGHILEDKLVERLLMVVQNSPELVTSDWLMQLAPHLKPQQLAEFYRASNILGRLSEQL